MASVKLSEIIERMKLENLTPEIDISKTKITQPDINRPALQMAGYFEHYEATRLQIIGFVEYSYMQSMEEKTQDDIYDKLVKLRDKKAKKLGYENFVKLGYLQMNRNCYTADDIEKFRIVSKHLVK